MDDYVVHHYPAGIRLIEYPLSNGTVYSQWIDDDYRHHVFLYCPLRNRTEQQATVRDVHKISKFLRSN